MNFFKNDFKTGYKKRPFDGYKSVIDKLDEETKQKLDRQRTIGMVCTVAFVFILVVILAVTGIGIDKSKSVSGNLFGDKEHVLIECFGDSLTEGITVSGDLSDTAETTYPMELEKKLPQLLSQDGKQYKFKTLEVKNYGQAGSILQNTSCSRLSGTADIVLVLYTINNFVSGADYVDTLETNAAAMIKQGSRVFLLNYPIAADSREKDKLEQANNYIASAAKTMDLELIDLKSYFDTLQQEENGELFGSDRLHLTEDGYILMGDYVAEAVHDYYYETY